MLEISKIFILNSRVSMIKIALKDYDVNKKTFTETKNSLYAICAKKKH